MNKIIIITSSDKGSGIVIMDTNKYIEKLKSLLYDANTYIKKQETVNINTRSIKQSRNCYKMKTRTRLIPPYYTETIRFTQKTHTTCLSDPLCPESSGHPTTPSLGTVNPTHIN